MVPEKPNPIITLLTQVLDEMKDISKEYRFLKTRFGELARDKDEKIKNQRKMIEQLTAQRDRLRKLLSDHGIEEE
jgi:predicted nuclease with TOPRIM domain